MEFASRALSKNWHRVPRDHLINFCATAEKLNKETIDEYLSHHFGDKKNPNFEIEPRNGFS
jgi:hypothetical protein